MLGDWEHPYLTMDPAFEAEEVKVFGKMFEKGYIYKGLKPVDVYKRQVIHSEGKQQMVYKHAISTIVPPTPIDLSSQEASL